MSVPNSIPEPSKVPAESVAVRAASMAGPIAAKAASLAGPLAAKAASMAGPIAAKAASVASKQLESAAAKLQTTTIPTNTAPPTTPIDPITATPSMPTPITPTDPSTPITPTDPNTPITPTDPSTPITPTDPNTATPSTPTPMKTTDPNTATPSTPITPTDHNTDPEPDEDISFIDQIRKEAKEGKFKKLSESIKESIPSLPPFPAAAVLQIVTTLSGIFQQNIGKVSEYANTVLKLEMAKKKHQLELNDAFAEKATGPALDEHMGKYVDTVLSRS
jgi:hypothetical protein